MSTGIYIHYPFCLQKCSYCDFFSVGLDTAVGPGIKSPNGTFFSDSEFFDLIKAEFYQRMSSFSAPVESIYFGGGTASLMSARLIEDFLELFSKEFNLSESEITLEGNPENFSRQYINDLQLVGVNRINCGIQTFEQEFLNQFQRYYNKESYENILEILSGSNISGKGVDLIYGYPGQSIEGFLADLEMVMTADINHLSIYSLTREPETPYSKMVRDKTMKEPEEELQTEIFHYLNDRFQIGSSSFQQYEISNFAHIEKECRHNLRYWLYESYMGLGPGAHGFDGKLRYGNPRNIRMWKDRVISRNVDSGQLHNPDTDIPINILRMTSIHRDQLAAIFSRCYDPEFSASKHEAVTRLFEQWKSENHFFETDSWFRWNTRSMIFLDDFIYDLSEKLDSVGDLYELSEK